MINLLLPLLTTIFIQLGTVGIPYELVPTDDVILLINEIRNACSNSSDPAELFSMILFKSMDIPKCLIILN